MLSRSVPSAASLSRTCQSLFISFLTFLVIATLLSVRASAQVTDPTTAAQAPVPGMGHNYIGMGAETVNPADGSVSFDLPIATPAGRELSFPFGIHYNGSVPYYIAANSDSTLYWTTSNTTLGSSYEWAGWSYNLPTYTAQGFVSSSFPQPPNLGGTDYCWTTQNYSFKDLTGVRHALYLDNNWPDPDNKNPGNSGCSTTGQASGGGNHGLYATLASLGSKNQPALTVTDRSGAVFSFPAGPTISGGTNPTQPWGLLAQTITDRNGNQISLNTAGTGYKDTLGRTILSWSSLGSTAGDTFTVSGLGNITVKRITGTILFPEHSQFVSGTPSTTCGLTGTQSAQQSLVSEIDLPNGQKYSFTYDGIYGRLTKVTFPDGGYVRYVWGANQLSSATYQTYTPYGVSGTYWCYAEVDTPAITDRYVSYDGSTEVLHQQFTYSTTWSVNSQGIPTWTTKSSSVTSTDMVANAATVTSYTYAPGAMYVGPRDYTKYSDGVPVEATVVYKDGSGNTLKTVNKSWADTSGMVGEQTILDNGQGSTTLRCYDRADVDQVVDVYEYDFQSAGAKPADPVCSTKASGQTTFSGGMNVSAMGPLLRHTATVNHSFGTATNILDRPDSVTVLDGAANQLSKVSYTYTDTVQASGATQGLVSVSGSRANVASVVRWLSGATSSPTATYTYFDTGQTQSMTDACGNASCAEMSGSSHTTTYSYADSFASGTGTAPGQTNAYITQVTHPNTGATHVEKFTWGYTDGLLRSRVDENNQTTSYQYADSLLRLTKITAPDGGVTSLAYTDTVGAPSVTTTKSITSSVNRVSSVTYDGMAHPVQTSLTSDPDGTTYTTTSYDGFGRKLSVLNPYRSTTDSTYGFTTMQYDALGRTIEVTEPDGSAMLSSYSGNCTTTTDEAGHLRTTCTDRLGRINQVLEPGTGGSLAAYGSGTVSFTGAPQSKPINGTSGTGTVNVSGTEGSIGAIYDSGTVTIVITGAFTGGTFTVSQTYGKSSTASYIASALKSKLSATGSPVTATSVSGSITITSIATGTNANYSLAVSSVSNDPTDFDPPSFTAFFQGGALTGGTNGGTSYDSGTLTVTVDAFSKSVSYTGTSNNTPALVAAAFVTGFNSDLNSPVSASASGSVLTLSSKEAGADSNFLVSNANSWNTGLFSSASYTVSAPTTLSGGSNGSTGTAPATTLYTFDVLNNMTCAVQKGTDTTAFTTCAAAPAAWRPRSFTYDSLSRLTSSVNPETNTAATGGTMVPMTYSYDLNGNLMSKTYPASNQTGTATSTISYCYDNDNRLTKKQYGNSTTCASPVITYTYDGASCAGLAGSCYNIGHRTSMTDPAGSENWAFDLMGRPLVDKRTTAGLANSTTYTYSPYLDGGIASVKYPSGRIVNYTESSAGRLLTAADSSTSYVSAVHYAAQGAITSMGMGASGTAVSMTEIYNNRFQACWIYGTTGSALGNTSLCGGTDSSPGTLMDLQYNFNWGAGDNGNVVGITNERDSGRSTAYAYDSLNRIVSANTTSTSNSSKCWGEGYAIDAMGNMTALNTLNSNYTVCTNKETAWTATASNQNQMVMSGTSYDSAGNMMATLVGGITNSYGYNAENQMTSMTGLSTTTNYVYDGDGKRVEKTGGTTKLYWYGADGSVLDETDATGSFTNANFNEYIFFGGKRVAKRDSSGNVLHYLADNLGTSRAMAQVLSGQSTATACYDADFYPYGGERTVTNTCVSTQNYKFTGKERDTESGLDEFGARYYSSSMGRFTIPDWSEKPTDVPYASFGDPQSLNLYSYVQNNSLSRNDPTGHKCFLAGFGLHCAAGKAPQSGANDAAPPAPPAPSLSGAAKKAFLASLDGHKVGKSTVGQLAKTLSNEGRSLSGGKPGELPHAKDQQANALINNDLKSKPEQVAPATGTATAQDSQIMEAAFFNRATGGDDPVEGRVYFGNSASDLGDRDAGNGLKGTAGRESIYDSFGPFNNSMGAPQYIYIYNNPGQDPVTK